MNTPQSINTMLQVATECNDFEVVEIDGTEHLVQNGAVIPYRIANTKGERNYHKFVLKHIATDVNMCFARTQKGLLEVFEKYTNAGRIKHIQKTAPNFEGAY